ncbi:MAG: hypothetical protein PVF27_05230, partial [Gemmatimonadales bacterium]
VGGDAFEYPGEFDPLAIGFDGVLRWYVGERLGLGLTVQSAVFTFTEPDPGYPGIGALPGSRRYVIGALEVRARLRLDRRAAVQPFVSGALGYAAERTTRTFVCTNDAATEFWTCEDWYADSGGVLAAAIGVVVALDPQFRLEAALSRTSAAMGSASYMGFGLNDVGEWLGIRVGVSATLR